MQHSELAIHFHTLGLALLVLFCCRATKAHYVPFSEWSFLQAQKMESVYEHYLHLMGLGIRYSQSHFAHKHFAQLFQGNHQSKGIIP